MRNHPITRAEKYRVLTGPMGSGPELGLNGAFLIPQKNGPIIKVIISHGDEDDIPEMQPFVGWEHASVSVAGLARCPTWEEMCFIKDLFWREDEVVFQLHPAKEKYVNNHPYCLHLWRYRGADPPLPPILAVGIPGLVG